MEGTPVTMVSAAAASINLPTLEAEPKKAGWAPPQSTFPTDNYFQYYSAVAQPPPPYCSHSSSQDSTDGASSSSSTAFDGMATRHHLQRVLPQRRTASWHATSSQHQFAGGPLITGPLPTKSVPSCATVGGRSSSSFGGSHQSLYSTHNNNNNNSAVASLYANNAAFAVSHSPGGGAPATYSLPLKAQLHSAASRQSSVATATSGIVSDLFTIVKGGPSAGTYYKFSESGPPPSVHHHAHSHQTAYHAPPASSSTASHHFPITTTAATTSPSAARAVASPPRSSSGGGQRAKRDRADEIRQWWRRPGSKLCVTATMLVLFLGLVVGAIFFFTRLPSHMQFSWLAPELLRGDQQSPNQLQMDVAGEQVRFELAGSMPFKSNFISVLDFKTNKVAIVDSSLRGGNRNLVCFVMDLDRSSIPDIPTLQRAARNSESRTAQQLGWQEAWNFIPTALAPGNGSPAGSAKLFHPDVVECRGARWMALSPVNQNQKPMKCSECYDFCLPEYGIERDYIRDESFLNIVKRDCFYLFVPEWRSFAQAYSSQQNQQDFENYYRNGGHLNNPNANNAQQQSLAGLAAGGMGGQFVGQVGEQLSGVYNQAVENLSPALRNAANQAESRWISLQTVPKQIVNASELALRHLQSGANQLRQQLFPGNTLPHDFGFANKYRPEYQVMPQQQQQQQQQPYGAGTANFNNIPAGNFPGNGGSSSGGGDGISGGNGVPGGLIGANQPIPSQHQQQLLANQQQQYGNNNFPPQYGSNPAILTRNNFGAASLGTSALMGPPPPPPQPPQQFNNNNAFDNNMNLNQQQQQRQQQQQQQQRPSFGVTDLSANSNSKNPPTLSQLLASGDLQQQQQQQQQPSQFGTDLSQQRSLNQNPNKPGPASMMTPQTFNSLSPHQQQQLLLLNNERMQQQQQQQNLQFDPHQQPWINVGG